MTAVILDATKHWVCPSCAREHVTTVARPHTPMHSCLALQGVWAPFLPAADKGRHVIVDREDYVGGEQVTRFSGRPVMAVRTERMDGSNDCHVFAPLAVGKVEG